MSRSPAKDIEQANTESDSSEKHLISKDLTEESVIQEKLERNSSNPESSSSADDESDSADIGFKRKKRHRPRPKRDKAISIDKEGSQRRIRSLSEAISDIEARNKAAKEEMDKRMIRSQSESEHSTEVL